MTQLQAGQIVVHPNKPEWGPGKVVKVEPSRAHVVWRDLSDRAAKRINLGVVSLELAPKQADAMLDNLPPLVVDGDQLVLPRERVTFQQAVDAFLAIYPGGFHDPDYIGDAKHGERTYKLIAHEKAVERLGGGRFRELLESNPAKLAEEILHCERLLNIVSPFEKAAFKDAMRADEPPLRFMTTLCELLESEAITEEVFAPYAKAVCDLPAERGRVATWPTATIIPYLLQPERHLFLKPQATQNAADALGFHLNYDARPNWLTYNRLLTMAEVYREKLADLKPRDMIDVQSFFWVACGGD